MIDDDQTVFTFSEIVDPKGEEGTGWEETMVGDVGTKTFKMMQVDDDFSYHLTSNESEDGNNYDVVEDLVLHSCDQLNFPLSNRLFGSGG